MAGLATHILVAMLALVALTALTVDAASSKDDLVRKHKKYDPTTVDKPSGFTTIKKNRGPRQVGTEQRQYYPCTTCFKLGNREVCTNPYCPSEDYQCDKSSKRCHKKAKIRGGRVTTPPQEAPVEEQ